MIKYLHKYSHFIHKWTLWLLFSLHRLVKLSGFKEGSEIKKKSSLSVISKLLRTKRLRATCCSRNITYVGMNVDSTRLKEEKKDDREKREFWVRKRCMIKGGRLAGTNDSAHSLSLKRAWTDHSAVALIIIIRILMVAWKQVRGLWRRPTRRLCAVVREACRVPSPPPPLLSANSHCFLFVFFS